MDRLVITVNRRARASEKFLRRAMAVLAALFLLLAIAFSRGMMLPCFLMAVAYFAYAGASRRAYEYVLENGRMRIDRLTDRGRVTRHEFSLRDVEILALPDDPAVAPYKKGGGEKVPKFDYTSYEDGVAWYTMIVQEDGRREKLLLDLTPAAIARIRAENRGAVKLSP